MKFKLLLAFITLGLAAPSLWSQNIISRPGKPDKDNPAGVNVPSKPDGKPDDKPEVKPVTEPIKKPVLKPGTDVPPATRKASDTYLTVDTRNCAIAPIGGSKVITVSTDAPEWYIESVPEFCRVERTGDDKFTVTCEPNRGFELKGQIVVVTEKNRTVVNVKQGSGIGATINKIWLEVDAVRDGYKGLVIHLDLDVTGLPDHTIRANAYFENADGTKLYDLDQNFGTTDGQVCCGNEAVADSDDAHWDNFDMFIPYDQLHLSTGDYTLRFIVQVFDNDTGKYLTGSKKQGFTFTRH